MLQTASKPADINANVARANFRGCDWVLRDKGAELLLTMLRPGEQGGKPELLQFTLERDKLASAGLVGASLGETLNRIHNNGVHRFASGITTKGAASEVLSESLPSLGEYRVSLGGLKHNLGVQGIGALDARIQAATQREIALAEVRQPQAAEVVAVAAQTVSQPVKIPVFAAAETPIHIPVTAAALTSIPVAEAAPARNWIGRAKDYVANTVEEAVATAFAIAGVVKRAFAGGLGLATATTVLAAAPTTLDAPSNSSSAAPVEPVAIRAAAVPGTQQQVAANSNVAAPAVTTTSTSFNSDTDVAFTDAAFGGSQLFAAADPAPATVAAAPAPATTPAPAPVQQQPKNWSVHTDVQGEVGEDFDGHLTYGGHWNVDIDHTFKQGGDAYFGITAAGGLRNEFVEESNKRFSELICGCGEVRDTKTQYAHATGNDLIGNFDQGITLGTKISEHTSLFVEGGGIGRLDHSGLTLEYAGGAGIQYNRLSPTGRQTFFDLRGLASENLIYGEARLEQDLTKGGRLGIGADANVTVDHNFGDPNAYASTYLRLKLLESSSHKSRLDLVGGANYTFGGGGISLPGAELGAPPSSMDPHWHTISESHSSDEKHWGLFVGLRANWWFGGK